MRTILFALLCFLCVQPIWTQTPGTSSAPPGGSSVNPGQIYSSATAAGPSGDGVLDPNGDGYITLSGSVFSTYPSIIDESVEFEESGWEVIYHSETEPTNDLDTGSSCGATEIVDNNNTGQHAAYYRLIDPDTDATNRNEFLQFRIRLAQASSGAFGFSILLDTDQRFGTSGISSDPNAVVGNPGFEVEILVGTGGSNSGVTMQNVDGFSASSDFIELAHFDAGIRDQWSYARFSNCTSDNPIFVDFYVDFATMPAGITAASTLRMVFASSSSPSSSLGGSASDIGGVNDNNYPVDDAAFTVVVESTPTLSFSEGYACDDIDADNVCDDVDNCTDTNACNYDGSVNNVTCVYGTTWYADTDGDGLGNASSSQVACTQPTGYVSDNSDLCDDNTACVYNGNVSNVPCTYSTTWYADTDGDGLGNASSSQVACTQPTGYVSDNSDLCDDNTACNYDANSNANATCTYGATWYADTDGDGLGNASSSQVACTQPTGYVSDNSDLCDDLTANNYTANPPVPCTYNAASIVVVDTIVGCDGQNPILVDLDTLHTGTGSWTYSIIQNLTGFATASLSSNILSIDFSTAGTDSARIDISGSNTIDNASIEILVIEGSYPFWTSSSPDGANSPVSSTGGMSLNFSGAYGVPVTVHYFDDAVFIKDPSGAFTIDSYGPLLTAETDSSGNLITLPAGDYWIRGYTNQYGCFNPEPAISGSVTTSPALRLLTVPYILPE